MREVLGAITPDLRAARATAPAAMPSTVFLFSDRAGYEAYSALGQTAGEFSRHLDGNYTIIHSGDPREDEVARHEYVHEYLATRCPGVPRWLNEGMACFFQTLRPAGNGVRLGEADLRRLRELATEGLLPVEDLERIKPFSPGVQTRRYYATAWLLTHYLLTGDDGTRAKLGVFMETRRRGEPPTDWVKAFGRTPEALDRELHAYLARIRETGILPLWILSFRGLKPDAAFAFRPLPRAEALARLGLLLAGNPNAHPGEAEAHFQASLALDRRCGPAHLGLGMLLARTDKEEAASQFRQAADLEPDDALTQFLAGSTLLEASNASSQTPVALSMQLAQARSHLFRAADLGCTRPETLPRLAAAIRKNEHPSPGDLAQLEAFAARNPEAPEFRALLASQYHQAGRNDASRAEFQALAAQYPDLPIARDAAAQLLAMDKEAAESRHQAALAAFREQRYDAAVEAMKEALALVPETERPPLREELRNMEVLADLRKRRAMADAKGVAKAPRRP
jgi:tetratricopeptide (TPR) repeat protein